MNNYSFRYGFLILYLVFIVYQIYTTGKFDPSYILSNLFFVVIYVIISIFKIIKENSNIKKTNKWRHKAIEQKHQNAIYQSIDLLRRYNLTASTSCSLPTEHINRLKQNAFDNFAMEQIAIYLLQYYGLKNAKVKVVIDQRRYKSRAICKNNEATIELNIARNFTLDSILSILTIECANIYLTICNIKYKDELYNKILTDVFAIYKGTGVILKRGYPTINNYSNLNMFGIRDLNLGYLNTDEITFVMKQINKLQRYRY